MNIGNGAERRALIDKVWKSQAVKKAIGTGYLFDGNKLAWSLNDLREERRALVDLDQEQGRRPGREPNTFRFVIRKTKRLDLGVLQNFLDGRVSFDNSVLEAINFADHLLRETPTTNDKFITVKRQFFTRNSQKANLHSGVEALRGVYQSLRLAQHGKQGGRLVVNLDVAHSCFWTPQRLLHAIIARHNSRDPAGLVHQLRPIKDQFGETAPSPNFRVMERVFRKLTVVAIYTNQKPGSDKREWVIKRFLMMNAKEYLIEMRNKNTGEIESSQSLYDYFRLKYQHNLSHWQLPVVEMTKKGTVYPLELLHLQPFQRYLTKLDEKQTADMIKFAVSRPQQRMQATNEGKNALNWAGDPILKHFGLQVSSDMLKIKARLLKNPRIQFGGSQIDPGNRGRWDLRGKRFHSPNPNGLQSWGVGVFPGRGGVDQSIVNQFLASFVRAYQAHGGRISNPRPNIQVLPADAGVAVEKLFKTTGDAFKLRPQILIFIVPSKDSLVYHRVKKSCDCRYGVVSQVMQYAQVQKNNGQYISNVLMKVNAKLGGTTSQAIPNPAQGSKPFSKPTLIIGADVSHASPGSLAPSTAALTISLDKFGGRYAAAVQTNGQRVEMITEDNFRNMLAPLGRHWVQNIGGGRMPQHIYYFRDGVSEGQYQHVMRQEVPRIRAIMKEVGGDVDWSGTLTVVICSKRHHVRAYPEPRAADNNGNPQPGLLIEQGVTSPHEWDFYLYSHIALQGTSRPVHYTILQDQANHGPNQIQNMIYEHCYHYMRSTTSVSLFPAVYYAHLASNRAKAHEDTPFSDPSPTSSYKQNVKQVEAAPPPSEVPKLLPILNTTGMRYAMWYI